MRSHDADELSRARLAFVSAGQPSLTAPRRGVPEEQPEQIDEPPPDAATRLTRTHLVAIVALLGVLTIIVATSLLRSTPDVVPASPVMESATVTPSAPAPEPSAEPQLVRVHVLGGVNDPGVVSVRADAIVADAITAAGGLAADAKPGDLNLAAPVAAGMQVKVGTAGEESRVEGASVTSGATDGGPSNTGKVNLNTATAGELESLPGVGPVMAGAIVAWRDEHGGFTSTSELQEVSGIGPKTFAKLEPLVGV